MKEIKITCDKCGRVLEGDDAHYRLYITYKMVSASYWQKVGELDLCVICYVALNLEQTEAK